MDSESESEVETRPTSKGKGKATEPKEIKRRSSKACDNCRKSKCKCTRAPGISLKTIPLPACDNCTLNKVACTYAVTSKKRGPPKGYIEVLESKLKRLEVLLGKIVESEDPRTQPLLQEILGDEAAQELLAIEIKTSIPKPARTGRKIASPAIVETGFAVPTQSTSTSYPIPPPPPLPAAAWPTNVHNPFSPPPSNSNTNISGSFPPSSFHSDLPPLLPPAQNHTNTTQSIYQPPYDPTGQSASLPRESQFGPASSRWQKRRLSTSNVSQYPGHAKIDERAAQYASGSNQQPMDSLDVERASGREVKRAAELEDVLGQLSLNENEEVRYHGRSSGLYLISKSSRYSNSFWRMPASGLSTSKSRAKSENEILQILNLPSPLPDLATSTNLLDIYWTHVHPHFPIVYRPSFERQWRYGLENPETTSASTPSGRGKVPTVLLLAMYALAARYDSVQMERGEEWLEKTTKILNHDYASSRQVTVQVLLLLSYLAIGGGGSMSAAWVYSGMAIRIAEDLGLNRAVENWSVSPFSEEEKESRKFVWFGCILMDRYVSSFIGRPGAIHEGDYDTAFPTEKGVDATLSCFNASCHLAVLINSIITSVYPIRAQATGQSSDAMLSLLDQSLASWYTDLPPHLSYHPGTAQIPPPHVLNLHLQFYAALILLHRPYIPGQQSPDSLEECFPSHSVCTTAANAITAIISTFSATYTLRHCPPTVIYPVFSAAIISVYNASFDESLGEPAKTSLRLCMDALREMSVTWGSAARQWELLISLVDLTPPSDSSMSSHPFPRPLAPADDRSARSYTSPPPVHATSNVRGGDSGSRSLGRSERSKRRKSNCMSRSREGTGQPGFVSNLPPPTFYNHPYPPSTTSNPPTSTAQYIPSPSQNPYDPPSTASTTSPQYPSSQPDYSQMMNAAPSNPYAYAPDSAFYGVPIGASTNLGEDDWAHLLSGYDSRPPV